MYNKRGIELSVNFLVILIISIILFGFGITFITKLTREATDLQQLTVSELDQRIGSLVCEGSDRVCIGIDRKTIKKTKFGVFGVRIINIIDEEDFIVQVKPSEPMGYKLDKSEIRKADGHPELIINPDFRELKIKKNDVQDIGIGIEVPRDAVSGTYILNVDITRASSPDPPYAKLQKLYVDVP